ncbi:MAG: hypothetical protein GF347_03350 [Candidatus Moranbacteria bacterium]|nr:hypothetical protein [Candidatus Moranbacteria bacterium]
MMKKKKRKNIPVKDYKELVEKVDEMKKQDKMDLSSDQDLSIAIMNLISIEEHFFFTAEKTEKGEYYELLKEVRDTRKVLLKQIITEYEGEVWCISKHLLAASMRLMEVGTKQLGIGNNKKAKALFRKAYDLYSLFWGLNMKIINAENLKSIGKKNKKKTGDKEKSSNNSSLALMGVQKKKKSLKKNKTSGFTDKLRGWVKKAIDCCIE